MPSIVSGQYKKQAEADFTRLNKAAEEMKQAGDVPVFKQMPKDDLSGVTVAEAAKSAAKSRQASLDEIQTAKEKADALQTELQKPVPTPPKWPLLGNQKMIKAESELKRYHQVLSEYQAEFSGVTALFEAKYQGWLDVAEGTQKIIEATATRNVQGYLSSMQGLANAAQREGEDIKAVKPVQSDAGLLTTIIPLEEQNGQLAGQIVASIKTRELTQASGLLPQLQQNDEAINAELRKYLPALQERSKLAQLAGQFPQVQKQTQAVISGINS